MEQKKKKCEKEEMWELAFVKYWVVVGRTGGMSAPLGTSKTLLRNWFPTRSTSAVHRKCFCTTSQEGYTGLSYS